MASFELVYEAEEDVLEITFELFDENFARALTLSENIVLYTDLSVSVAWGLTFYDYARLLEEGETTLEGMQPFSEADARRVLHLLTLLPASHFLQALDASAFRVRILAPNLQALI